MLPLDYHDVTQAREQVYRYLCPTLLNEWPLLTKRLSGFSRGETATCSCWRRSVPAIRYERCRIFVSVW